MYTLVDSVATCFILIGFKEIGPHARKDLDIERGSDSSCEDEGSSEDVHDIEDKPNHY